METLKLTRRRRRNAGRPRNEALPSSSSIIRKKEEERGIKTQMTDWSFGNWVKDDSKWVKITSIVIVHYRRLSKSGFFFGMDRVTEWMKMSVTWRRRARNCFPHEWWRLERPCDAVGRYRRRWRAAGRRQLGDRPSPPTRRREPINKNKNTPNFHFIFSKCVEWLTCPHSSIIWIN